nr:MAG TPA: hypothetical protein [Caudoviricetes sp.]
MKIFDEPIYKFRRFSYNDNVINPLSTLPTTGGNHHDRE